MPKRPSLTVVIPCYKDNGFLTRCLEPIKSAVSSDDEVLLVCDGGDFEWAERTAKECGVKYLPQSKRSGPGAARNLGAKNASGEILLFLDSDVVIAPDVIEKVRKVFADKPHLSALIGSYDDSPGDPGFFSQYKNLQHHYVHQEGGEESFTFWGACGAIRREIYLDIGGFDERYDQPSIEDIELGYRLHAAGHEMALCKDIQVKHLKRWTGFSMVKTDLLCRAIPWARLIMQSGCMKRDLNLKQSARLSVALVYLMLLSLAAAIPFQPALWVFGACAILLLVLNHHFYGFLARKKGMIFSLLAIPVHWLYFFYCGLGYLCAKLLVLLDSKNEEAQLPSRSYSGDATISDDPS